MNCGREHGGLLADAMGECPTSRSMRFDGENGGKGAGRACWMVADPLCRKGHSFSKSASSCLNCEFYNRVQFEEAGLAQYKFVSEKV